MLYRIKGRIVKQVKKVRQSVGLTKRFRSFSRVSKKVLMQAKKLYRNQPEKQKHAIKQFLSMTNRVVRQASRIGNSLYARGHKTQGRKINQLVSIGRHIVNQSHQVFKGEKPNKRLYLLHEHQVAAIKKGKANKPCEFGSVVGLFSNDDQLVWPTRSINTISLM